MKARDRVGIGLSRVPARQASRTCRIYVWNQFLGSLNFKYRHWRAGTITLFQLGYYSVTSPHKFFKSSSTLFRIRDILVRILGSVFSKMFDLRLWIWIRLRILRFSSVTSKICTQKISYFFYLFC
jgi:hypothetical protein